VIKHGKRRRRRRRRCRIRSSASADEFKESKRGKKQPYCSRWFTCGSDSVLYYIIYILCIWLYIITIYRLVYYTHSLTWTRARRYIVSGRRRRRKHCARLCVAVYHRYYNKTNNTRGGGGRARVLRLALSRKRGRDGRTLLSDARARTAGGNRFVVRTS